MITKRVKEVWETEAIRILILISLLIQALLTFFAPCRKNKSASYFQVSLSVLYLSADAIALYIIGLISNSRCHHYAESTELLPLWASFLLVHLGGPDTITALALEDNELWRRHALHLATQVSVSVYVFARSFQYHTNNRLWIPTVLMFIDGIIKYFERTCALYFASRDNFKYCILGAPEAGSNYARLMDEYYSATRAHIPAKFQEDDTKGKNLFKKDEKTNEEQQDSEPSQPTTGDEESSVHPGSRMRYEPSTETKVQDAHLYYEMYKPLLAEGFLSSKNRQDSRSFFLDKCDYELAYEIIQIELNLIYDAFYTKSLLLQKRRAYARVLCFAFVIVSLLLFCLNWDLKKQKTDAIVTFLLFGGAIALDICSAAMFVLSNWWLIIIPYSYGFIQPIMYKIVSWSRWARRLCHSKKRWSQTFSQYNLLQYCVKKRPLLRRSHVPHKVMILREYLNEFLYVKVKKVDEELMTFIISEIYKKSELASEEEAAKEAFSARGNMVLGDEYYRAAQCLRPWTLDVDYDESLMIWHLATDICFWIDSSEDTEKNRFREFSKALSDYMLYLVMWQQSLPSSLVGSSKQRFLDTCAAARKSINHDIKSVSWLGDFLWKAKKKFCYGSTSRGDNQSSPEINELEYYKRFSQQMLTDQKVPEPLIPIAKEASETVLFDACCLAQKLQMFGDHKWKITSKVWAELLCYAAAHCPPRYHIAQLSKGGELITVVWLFMAHLGIGERFSRDKTRYGATTQLIIGK